MKRTLASIAAAIVALVLLPNPAAAQGEAVTLSASSTAIEIGDAVTLSGSIAPAAAGETVQLLDATDLLVASATTDGAGAFSIVLTPRDGGSYRAAWGEARSEPVTVQVRASVSARMSKVRLFDVVTVRGTVEPARPGEGVEVALVHGGRVVKTRRVAVGSAGGFVARFRVMEPGTYRARATFSTEDLLRDRAVTGADSTPLPRLSKGKRGVFVELLERRLAELRYRLLGARDGEFDQRTADAVVAFRKVQRMERTFVVDATVWRALADPVVPRPRDRGSGFHIEVDQTRQVLFMVRDGSITDILHISTGKASTPTRDGRWRVARKIAGYSPGRLYYPSYFDGNRALHGWTEVPTYPASHGCVRLPYWNAQWVFRMAPYGTTVLVYH